jgi:hypothetical protein
MTKRWCLVLAACGHHVAHGPAAKTWQGTLSASVAADDPIVATVDGDAIRASEVAAMAAAQRIDARAALDRLIDLDVAAAEAIRRGLADDPDVADARERERVRRFSEDQFLAGFTPAQIPDELVDKVLAQRNTSYVFDHEKYLNTAFCRVTVPKDAPAEDVARARDQLQSIRDALVAAPPATVDDFLAACTARASALGLRRGESFDQDKFSTTRHHSAVEEYASAAWTLQRHGDLTPPSRTPWGWDLIWLDSILEERHASHAEAASEVRTWPQVLSLGRQQAFQKWADGLAAKHAISRDDSLLERVSVDAPVN